MTPNNSHKPNSKLTAAGASGVLSVLVLWLAPQFGLEMTAEVAGAFVLVATWVAGYWKSDPAMAKAQRILETFTESETKTVDEPPESS